MSASAALVQPTGTPGGAGPGVTRMAVAWQNPVSRAVRPVGLLRFDGAEHEFFYLRSVSEVEDFRPFLNFPDLNQRYTSRDLFPMFAQRVLSPHRPDYSEHLRRLDLSETAGPWEQLARTEGRLASDTIQVLPEPMVGPSGATYARFLVAGIRHKLQDEVERNRVLAALHEGDSLEIVDEPSNPKNPRAMLVSARHDGPIGWVPDMLVDYLHKARVFGPVRLSVVQANGPEAPMHMRLLVAFEGMVPTGYRPFDGPMWQPYL